MTFRVGETGKRVYVVTNFDMSSATALEIKAVPPSGEQNQKTWTATLETGPLSSIVLEDGTAVASVAANESVYYDLATADDLDESGTYVLSVKYTNTTAVPDDVFVSDPVSLVVLDDNFDNTL